MFNIFINNLDDRLLKSLLITYLSDFKLRDAKHNMKQRTRRSEEGKEVFFFFFLFFVINQEKYDRLVREQFQVTLLKGGTQVKKEQCERGHERSLYRGTDTKRAVVTEFSLFLSPSFTPHPLFLRWDPGLCVC